MISMIAVVGKNREIGYKNKLLWNIPEDMDWFKKMTLGSTVIMGDKTLKSIGGPLPNRNNIVLSLDKDYKAKGCIVSNSLKKTLDWANKQKDEVFVIGGGMIYKLALPFVDRLYITLVDDSPQADTFFPDYSDFSRILYKRESENNGLRYTFLKLEKK